MDIEIDGRSDVPPYQQIVDQVVAGVGSGDLVTGARLPTVRHLATELGLAVNTVAKAYRQLEAEGHVETLGRRGTVIRGAGPASDEVALAARRLADAARRHGLDLDSTVGLLRRVW